MSYTLLYLLSYACIAVFFAAVLRRVIKINSMPMHLRWELYPVGHEPGERGKYGGSYLEEVDWWTKENHSSLIAEAKYMGPEIILLKGVWEHNRSLWFLSFPFHFGLYMLMGMMGLIAFGGVLQAFGLEISSGACIVGKAIYFLTILTGYVGFTLGLFGSVGLLIRRLTDDDLKDFTAPVDLLNLALFILVIGAGLVTFLFVDHDFGIPRTFFAGLVTFNFEPLGSNLAAVTIALGMLLMTYIPLTHMSHFFSKYFMYHNIRWDDAPNHPGEKIEKELEKLLALKPTWAAKHIGADGTKTWADIATTNPTAEDK